MNEHIHTRPRNNKLPKVVCDGRGHYTYSDRAEIWHDGVLVAVVQTGSLQTRNHDVLAWVNVKDGKVVPK